MKLNLQFSGVCIIFLIQYSTQNEFKCESDTAVLCKLNNGTNACCPIQDGTCCESGNFCCPKDFKCDLNKQECIQGNVSFSFNTTLEPRVANCADDAYHCRESETCCPTVNKTYGCCNAVNAVCCDYGYCCPAGYKCVTRENTIWCARKVPRSTYILDNEIFINKKAEKIEILKKNEKF